MHQPTANSHPEEVFYYWIRERERIRKRKEAGKPQPWTNDPILAKYRFCNVHREDDYVTRWIAYHWREPMAVSRRGQEKLWFWMLMARLVNHPPTLFELQQALEGQYSEARFIEVMQARANRKEKCWGSAYIVSTNGHNMPKSRYIAQKVLTPACHAHDHHKPKRGDTLTTFANRLMELNGVSGFTAGQVVADAKYADAVLRRADDWHTFAFSGPGSRRGLNRIVGRHPKQSWRENDWLHVLLRLQHRTLSNTGLDLHAQDLQNCLCETDKYLRTLLGEGRPRANYTPRKKEEL